MKKNLKKVISAVLSLALAASSFVAMNVSAATFADVADTASYAEAVNALAALGAISGYEDGTFQPNNNITRAEVATMVVAALNMTADAQNSGSTTQFADVNEKAAWAAGYVNVGVAQGYISGMSATEFAPQDNVTYAQVLSMLTRILGYGEFAEARGGWPNGYLTAAATAGILSGVSAGANDAVTRAQVAQLIWNALQAPMLDITTFSTAATGTEMQKMDGKDDRAFKTPLSDRFDAYVLNIEVKDTSKTLNSTNGPEITMTLTNNNDWDPETELLVKDVKTADLDKTEVAVGNTAAESYLFSSAKVVATYIDDEWALVYFAPTAKVAQKPVDGTLLGDIEIGADDTKDSDTLKIKKSKTTNNTTNYKLSNNTEVYVNGVKYATLSGTTEAAVENLLKNSDGDTILVEDSTKSGYYSKIMVDYSIVARINQIVTKSDSVEIILAGLKYPGNVTDATTSKSSFKISNDDIEDGTKTVYVEKNGQVADLASLAKEDIVAVRYDISGSIEGSSFVDVLATTDVITGKFYSYDAEEKLYEIGEAQYESVGDVDLTAGVDALENGSSYTFKLDPMGRLYDYEIEAESKNFAIVERYVDINNASSSASEYSYVQVMTLDGQSKTLYIEDSYDKQANAILSKIADSTIAKTQAMNSGNNPIESRIIEYTVKASTGRIKEVKVLGSSDIEVVPAAEYNSNTNKLGKVLSANAVVLDATDYTESISDGLNPSLADYQASSLAALADGVKYDVVLVYKSNSEYMYAIIKAAGATFGADSNFTVAAANFSRSSKAIVNDEDVYTLDVLENGASSTSKLNIATNARVFYGGSEQLSNSETDFSKIKAGSIFFYTTDADGFVNKISVVYEAPANYNDILYATTSKALTNVKAPEFDAGGNAIEADDWYIGLDDGFKATANDEIQLMIAPIYQDSAKGVSVANVEYDANAVYVDDKGAEQKGLYYMDTDDAAKTGKDTAFDFAVAADAKIYSFDMSGDTTGTSRFSSGAFAGIEARDCEADGKAYFGLIKGDDNFNFAQTIQMAFLMVVDGTVTNALVFAN